MKGTATMIVASTAATKHCQRKLGALRCSDTAMTASLRSSSSPVLRCSRTTPADRTTAATDRPNTP